MAPALTYDEALAYLAQFINYETRQPVSYAPDHFNVQAFAEFLQTLGHRTWPSPRCILPAPKAKAPRPPWSPPCYRRQGCGRACSPHRIW